MKNITFAALLAMAIWPVNRAEAFCDTSYSASGTSSASVSSTTRQISVSLTAGVDYEITTCGLSSTDTYLRLKTTSGSEITYNDDACGLQSKINYTPSSTGTYVIWAGCYSSGTCSGTVKVTPRYATSGTSSATVSSTTKQIRFRLSGGVTYTISTCGTTTTDTYLRLKNTAGTELTYNDDACGLQSTITYTAPSTGDYVLWAGCYSSGSCDGTISMNPPPVCSGGDVSCAAFAHGTGNQTDAANDYWTWDFINKVRAGLPDPSNYTVINCQFEEYMWTTGASGCLASQLKSLIDSKQCTKLTVFTHSNGGNVMRWIMSNPTANPDFQAVMNVLHRVNALAPTSAGTPLANAVTTGSVFETALGWLLGYDSDAVWMQRTDWMAVYNANNLYGTAGRPALPKPFRYVGGTDVESSPTDGDSYCGGWDTNVGLEITQEWLDGCSDGFINCSSQSAAGTKFYWDYERTNNPNTICVLGIGDCGSWEPLSHGQSRRDCFGHPEALRNEGYL